MSAMQKRLWVMACAVTMVWAVGASGAEQGLKRRGMMGVQLGPVTEEVKTKLKLDDTAGVVINGVIPDGAAAAAGVKADDVVRKVGEDKVTSVPELMGAMRKYGAGDTVPLTVLREGKEVKLDLVLKPRPGETWTDCELLYESAGEPGQRVRTLITKPKSEGKRPAVVFLMGPSRQPAEFSFPGPHPVKSLITELSKAGYVTVRFDRPGVGDSEGNFDSLSPSAESSAIQSVVAKLHTLDFVDGNSIFLLTHGIGSAAVPDVVKNQPVRGVITYAAITRPWPESVTETLARQWKLELLPDDQIKTRTEAWKTFVDQFINKKQAPADIAKENPQLREVLGDTLEGGSVLGMPSTYAREVAATPPSAWANVKVPVLALWGESDFVANRKDSEMIAELVNKNAPGKAKFVALPQTDHDLGQAADQEEAFMTSLSGSTPFQSKVTTTLTQWMSEQPKGS